MVIPRRDTENQIECHRCGDTIEDWCEVRRYGFWDPDVQNFESHGGIEHRYCRDCWQDDFGRPEGAHFQPDTAEQLWNVLDAANGDLAAVLTWWSSRPAVRVVDGEPEAAVTKPVNNNRTKPDGTPILDFESYLIGGFDRDEFDETCDPPAEMNVARLVVPERTAFEHAEEVLPTDE